MSTPTGASSRLGTRLKLAREAAGLTQLDAVVALRQLGRVRLSSSTLQRWEYTGAIPLEDAMLLARAYEISLDELAGMPRVD